MRNRLAGGGRSHLRTRLRIKIPVNREKYREFCSSERLNRIHPLVKTGVNGFRPEIVTGNEQGNNRRDNRENVVRNRRITARRYLATQLIKEVKIFYTRLQCVTLLYVNLGIVDPRAPSFG